MDIGELVNQSIQAYSSFQQAHPIVGTMASSEVIFVAGDAASQLILDHKVDSRKLRYTAALAPLYGLITAGLIETGELVGRYISESPLVKSALGPNLWANFTTTFFFVNNNFGEKNDYKIMELLGNYRDIVIPDEKKGFFQRFKEKYIDFIPKKQFIYSVAATLSAWNVFQYYNYAYVSPDLRTTVSMLAGPVWVGIMSLWSLNARKEMFDKTQISSKGSSDLKD